MLADDVAAVPGPVVYLHVDEVAVPELLDETAVEVVGTAGEQADDHHAGNAVHELDAEHVGGVIRIASDDTLFVGPVTGGTQAAVARQPKVIVPEDDLASLPARVDRTVYGRLTQAQGNLITAGVGLQVVHAENEGVAIAEVGIDLLVAERAEVARESFDRDCRVDAVQLIGQGLHLGHANGVVHVFLATDVHEFDVVEIDQADGAQAAADQVAGQVGAAATADDGDAGILHGVNVNDGLDTGKIEHKWFPPS